MELKDYTILCTYKPVNIVALADIHWGSLSCDVSKLEKAIKWIKNTPDTYWIGIGDFCELINYRDAKRFSPDNISKEYRIMDLKGLFIREIDDICKKLLPIANKCIGVSTGNHEFSADQYFDAEATTRICQNLGVNYLGWTSLVRLHFRRHNNMMTNVQTMCIEHGHFSGRTKGARVASLERRISDWYDIDILLEGHSHDFVSTYKTQLYLPKTGKQLLKEHLIVAGVCPSFYRTYQVGTISYAERKEYSPTTMGLLIVEIRPFVHIGNKNSERCHECKKEIRMIAI